MAMHALIHGFTAAVTAQVANVYVKVSKTQHLF